MLAAQSIEKMRMLEREKADMMMAHIQRHDDWEREKQREVERVQQLHRWVGGEEREGRGGWGGS